VRTLGAVNATDLEVLRKADAIYIEELRRAKWYDDVAGVRGAAAGLDRRGQGDERSYER
jgi:GMP synthase PP-ATPase subunit